MKKVNTRRALLLSALSLLLCMSMLVGTTFAWFTDSVTSGNNIIKSGTLDVTLDWANGTKAVPAVDSDEWKDASTGAIFDYDLWEPGYTEVRHIRIANVGTLALKYQLVIAANGEVSDLADVIDVYYVDPAVQVADRAALANAPKLGTLSEVLAQADTTASGNLKAGEELIVTLALKMQESAGNEYQDKSIGSDFAVQLLATQLTYEEDSFDDQYDKDAELPVEVATAADLAAALAEGGTVTLASDINLGATQIEIPAGVDAVIDLNGNDLTGSYTGTDHYAMFKIPNGASLTIEGDGEVAANTKATESNRSLALFQNSGELTLNGGTYNVNDSTEGQTWIIATIVDNRTSNASCATKLTINGGEYSVSGQAKNLFRNYPQQGGTATLIINNGTFNDKAGETTYIWNQEAGSYLGELYFNGGAYDAAVVYEDYNGQSDVHIAAGVTIQAYSGNN